MTQITRRAFVKATAGLAPLALADITGAAQAPRATAPPERFDFVIAGAGHNSLVCAAYLARAGYRVLVLEGRAMIGGGCKTAEVLLPGFKTDLCSTVHGGIQSNPVLRDNELNLRDYGLEYIDPDPVMHIPFLDGASITIWRDLERTSAEIERLSKKDAETFRRLVPARERYLEASDSERAKLPDARYWERITAMSGYDAAREIFESDYVRAASLACGKFGSTPGGNPGTGGQALSLMSQVISGRPTPKGGSGMLSVALGRFLEAHDAVVLTNKPVARLIIESGRCTGVECADGSQYHAKQAVVSTIHVKHLVEMAPRDLWGEPFLEHVQLFQPQWAMFVFHYALAEPPKYPLATGGTISTFEAAIMNKPERILRLGYDDARGEVNLEDIPLQIVCPSVADSTRAPAGHATFKIEGNLPYALEEGPQHWDAIKEQVADNLMEYFRRYAPNLTPDKILARFLMSPVDIERMNPAMWRGGAHHGDRQLPQLVPHRLPVPGLYQTGACTPTGGSITGRPGRNAAAAILQDLGTSIEEVVARPSRTQV